ncbi:eukaryotic translation elongation factor 1 epsilon-1-like isoform X2 [Ostrea edulis]|uniref:eukaryotic translation elongation factor 1 epsilon-1-like isoform X2 n=1 Tax=Ostrea edulis TaxID=37623 RepID=UPI0024AF30A4|nr:eukaryotic translation elongation factor 1 epsilon-1-like isoform X2 [Ostrea edulis]
MEELNNLATFLGVSGGKLVIDAKEQIPVLKAGNGLTVRGLVSVAKQLVRQSDSFELKGTTPEERAAIDQWLEYRVTQVDKSHQDKDVSTVLKDTNTYLSNHVYFVGYQPTLADIILYLGLYRIFEELTFMDKQKYIHVSRWFSNMQSLFADKFSKKHIVFQRNKIFCGTSH